MHAQDMRGWKEVAQTPTLATLCTHHAPQAHCVCFLQGLRHVSGWTLGSWSVGRTSLSQQV